MGPHRSATKRSSACNASLSGANPILNWNRQQIIDCAHNFDEPSGAIGIILLHHSRGEATVHRQSHEFKAKTPLQEGLQETIDWYRESERPVDRAGYAVTQA